jgi:cytochrome c-type biogenesis protein CcmE
MRFKTSSVISVIVAFIATGGIVTAFLLNASPYLTIAEAKKTTYQKVNIVGDINKETLVNDPIRGTLTFQLIDLQKDTIKVIYTGSTPANMGEATRVVAIGQVQGNVLHADQLRIKCPSKYESERSPAK